MEQPGRSPTDPPTSLPVAGWSDGATVHSVVLPDTDGLEHEYVVERNGEVLARCDDLEAVADWRARNADGVVDVLDPVVAPDEFAD